MKTCTKCSNLKNFSEFHKKSSVKDGYAHWCKSCVREYDQREHDDKRVFAIKEKEGKIHCRRCERYLDKSNFYNKLTYCKECSSSIGHKHNIKRFGITVDQYLEIEKSQNGVCAICKKPEQNKKRLSIDHDHRCCNGAFSCGKCIRGLLCSNCNTFLGNAKDSIDTLQNAITYLKNF